MCELPLSLQQRRQLQRQLEQTQDVRLYRRTLALLAWDQGLSMLNIARLLQVSRQSVYNWVATYQHGSSPQALADEPRSGRPLRFDHDQQHLLQALLAYTPQDFGYPEAGWTVPLLQKALYRGSGHWFSDSTLRRALRSLTYVWKRPRYLLIPDPEQAKKNAASASKSGPCRPAVSSWPRTKPTCCSFRPCGPPGRSRAKRARSG